MARRRRQVRPRQQQPRHVVLTEGTVTEVDYFIGLNRITTGCRIVVPRQLCGKSPNNLVGAAIRYRRQKRADGDWTDADRIWCVVDRDEWPDLEETRRRADLRDVGLLITSPCFEFWLLLHFEDCRRFLTKEQLRHAVRAHLPEFRKAVDFGALRDAVSVATERARILDAIKHRATDLPRSDLHRLIGVLQLR